MFASRLLRSTAAFVACCAGASFAGPARAATSTTFALPVLATPATMTGATDATWAAAVTVPLETDFTNRRKSGEATRASIAREADAIDVAFDAEQREAPIASQQTNGSAVLSDDYVGVYLWPQGTQGFAYAFFANPRGARYQTSSENSAYAPQWTAVAKASATGYAVTMRIPLDLIRSGGSDTWRVQFVRQVVATNNLDVWTYSPTQNNVNDPSFAGTITGVIASTTNARPKARAQLYALGELTPPSNGGSTSRLGADFSLPVTPTSSLVASFHPDYSNVEVDQQTIAPNAFAYQYAEVRPFFTQAAQAFNYNFSCSDCPQLLYTPSIPTFRQGYAYEGAQGPLNFGAFDAVGAGRNDQAQAFDYNTTSSGAVVSANVQHIGVDTDQGLHDETTSFTTGYENRHSRYFIYLNGATDRGSLVTSPGDGNYVEAGGGYIGQTLVYGANYQQIGAQFSPADGFVSQTDITGYEAFLRDTINFAPRTLLHDLQVNGFAAEYHNRFALRAQEDASAKITADLRDLLSVQAFYSEAAIRIERGEFLPFDGNGGLVGYRVNTGTPSYVQYAGGPYYHGKLDSWSYVATLPLAPSVHLRLESDEDKYLTAFAGEAGSTLWLDRASLDWQLSRDASFDVGARKLVGAPLPGAFGFAPGQAALTAGNITVAFHLLQQKNEFYVVYGNPNSLATTPALYLKWIRYIGAGKGT